MLPSAASGIIQHLSVRAACLVIKLYSRAQWLVDAPAKPAVAVVPPSVFGNEQPASSASSREASPEPVRPTQAPEEAPNSTQGNVPAKLAAPQVCVFVSNLETHSTDEPFVSFLRKAPGQLGRSDVWSAQQECQCLYEDSVF